MKKNKQNGNKDKRARKHGGGRPKQFHHRVLIPFATDTLERIEKVLEPKQTRTDFIRGAVGQRLEKLT